MNASWFELDVELCGRLCLVLAHSLWQFALLAGLAAIVSHAWKKLSPEQLYALYAGALLLGLLLLPITFALMRLPGESVALSDLAIAPQRQTLSIPHSPPAKQLPVQQVAPPPTVANVPLQSPAIAQVSHPADLLSWAPWFVACYAAGVAIMLVRLLRGLWQNYRLSITASPLTSSPLSGMLRDLTSRWALRVTPALAMTERVIVPQVVGLWRPVILLPAATLSGLRPDELEMILAHELAHVRRYDLWANLMQRLTEAVLFFNPAVWYLSRRISTFREYCCDEATCRLVQQTAADTRVRYAEALLRAVELTQVAPHGQKLAALAASGNRPSELRRRVARLFGEPLREPLRVSRTGLVTLLVGIAILVMIPLARQNAAETKEDPKQAESTKKPTVEVVAIGTHDEEPQRWWDAEGKLLEDVPFHVRGASVTGEARQLVFRIADLPKDAHVTWELSGCGSNANAEVVLNGEESPHGYFSKVFAIREDSPTVNLRVGIAVGEWQTVIATKGIGSQSMGLPDGANVAFAGAFAEEDRFSKGNQATSVVVSHNFRDMNVRLVAVDKSGQSHRSAGSTSHGVGNNVLQTKYSFRDVLPDQVDHFEFQTREYVWTEIKDLPVEQGETDQAAVELQPNEVSNIEPADPASAKVAALEEICASYEAIYQRVEALHRQGTAGGEETKKWLALYHLSLARAELALAKGDADLGGEHYDKAIEAAEENVKALRAIYESGRVSLDEVLEAEVRRAKAKLAKSEARQQTGQRIGDGRSTGGENDSDKSAEWSEKLHRLTEHNQTAFAIGPQMIAQLSPQEAWEVTRAVWPEIEIDEVKTGLLKTFEFARHPKVLEVLNLGAIDDSEFVRDYAYSYLQNYALRDFKSEEHDYHEWRREYADKPVEEVLKANCRWFVESLRDQPPITDPLAWREMEMMLELRGSKSSYPSKAEYLRQAGLLDVLKSWLDDPRLDENMKRNVTEFLGSLDKTLDGTSSYENADLSGRSLKGLTLQGNVDELFMGANLSNVDLSEATIVGGIKAFYETNFSGANLSGATMIGRAAFQKANLEGATLEHTLLQGGVAGLQIAKFDEAHIQNSRLLGSLQLATFRNAELVDSRLEGRGPALQRANFDGATLVRTALIDTSFQAVNLNNTKFVECDLSTTLASDLASSKFDPSTPPRYDAKTKFPDGFDPQKHGWKLIGEP